VPAAEVEQACNRTKLLYLPDGLKHTLCAGARSARVVNPRRRDRAPGRPVDNQMVAHRAERRAAWRAPALAKWAGASARIGNGGSTKRAADERASRE